MAVYDVALWKKFSVVVFNLVITDTSRSCLDFRDVIVSNQIKSNIFDNTKKAKYVWYSHGFMFANCGHCCTQFMFFCLLNYALYPVIRLCCGLILLEYARFLASFFLVYVYSFFYFFFY